MKNIFKVNKLFLSIFLPVIIIDLILVLSFTGVTYSEIYKSVESTLLNEKKNYINWVQNDLDQQVQMIEHTFSTYSESKDFKDDMTKPIDYRDYQHIRSILSRLNSMSLSSSAPINYTLVSQSYNWKVNGNTFTDLNTQEVQKIQKELDEQNNAVYWKPSVSGIQMVMQLPVFSNEKNAIGIAEIGQRKLDKLTQNYQDDLLLIVNKQDDLLYGKNEFLLTDKNLKNILENKEDMVLPNGDKVLVSHSLNSQWVFVTMLKKSTVKEKVSNAQIGLFLIALLLVIVLVLISYRLAKRYIKPFQTIGNRLSEDKTENYTTDIIVDKIDNLLNEQQELKYIVDNQKNQVETLFIRDLLGNRLSKIDVAEKLEDFSYNLEGRKKFYVLLFQIDLDNDDTKKSIQLFALINLISEIFTESLRSEPILFEKDTVALIVGLETKLTFKERERQLSSFCMMLNKYVEKLNFVVYIGISNEYDELSDTSLACQLAKEAIRYQRYYNQDVFFYNKEVEKESIQKMSKYPKLLENQLFDNIRKGKMNEISPIYNQLFSEIIINNPIPINFKIAVTTLLNSLLDFSQLMGVSTSFYQNSQKYDELLGMEDISKLKGNIYSIFIKPLISGSQPNQKSKCISEKMLQIIHTNYDQDLSLEIIGDQLDYSPVYLSVIFKKEYGDNFNDYLQNYRIEIAKKWLVETDMTIKEMSEQLQYSNSQNFIRFFKRREGTTPGVYRKNNHPLGKLQ